MIERGITLLGSWSRPELDELKKILAPLPTAWLERNPNLRSLLRRPVLTDAPPDAPGHSKYEPGVGAIVVFDKGVYDGGQIDPEQFRRSVYHELAHSLIRTRPHLLAEWTASTVRDGFVDEYARRGGPEEDFADSFSEFLINPDGTKSAVPAKAEFIRQLRDHADQEKVAMYFLRGFANELVKTAKPGMGFLAKTMARFGRGARKAEGAGKIGLGKALLGGGAAAAGAGVLAERHGEKKGFNAGTGEEMEIAERARMLGRQEGVMAYHQALQARLKAQGGE